MSAEQDQMPTVVLDSDLNHRDGVIESIKDDLSTQVAKMKEAVITESDFSFEQNPDKQVPIMVTIQLTKQVAQVDGTYTTIVEEHTLLPEFLITMPVASIYQIVSLDPKFAEFTSFDLLLPNTYEFLDPVIIIQEYTELYQDATDAIARGESPFPTKIVMHPKDYTPTTALDHLAVVSNAIVSPIVQPSLYHQYISKFTDPTKKMFDLASQNLNQQQESVLVHKKGGKKAKQTQQRPAATATQHSIYETIEFSNSLLETYQSSLPTLLQPFKLLTKSQFNNPPSLHRNLQGDFFYLDLYLNDNTYYSITACSQGFFVNASTVSSFSPREHAKLGQSTHYLLPSLLASIIPHYKSIIMYNSTIMMAKLPSWCSQRIGYRVQPDSGWFVTPQETTVCTMFDENLTASIPPELEKFNPTQYPLVNHAKYANDLILAVASNASPNAIPSPDNLSTFRNWNNEYQYARELPRTTPYQRQQRSIAINRVLNDFNLVATLFVKEIIDIQSIPPISHINNNIINNNAPGAYQLYYDKIHSSDKKLPTAGHGAGLVNRQQYYAKYNLIATPVDIDQSAEHSSYPILQPDCDLFLTIGLHQKYLTNQDLKFHNTLLALDTPGLNHFPQCLVDYKGARFAITCLFTEDFTPVMGFDSINGASHITEYLSIDQTLLPLISKKNNSVELIQDGDHPEKVDDEPSFEYDFDAIDQHNARTNLGLSIERRKLHHNALLATSTLLQHATIEPTGTLSDADSHSNKAYLNSHIKAAIGHNDKRCYVYDGHYYLPRDVSAIPTINTNNINKSKSLLTIQQTISNYNLSLQKINEVIETLDQKCAEEEEHIASVQAELTALGSINELSTEEEQKSAQVIHTKLKSHQKQLVLYKYRRSEFDQEFTDIKASIAKLMSNNNTPDEEYINLSSDKYQHCFIRPELIKSYLHELNTNHVDLICSTQYFPKFKLLSTVELHSLPQQKQNEYMRSYESFQNVRRELYTRGLSAITQSSHGNNITNTYNTECFTPNYTRMMGNNTKSESEPVQDVKKPDENTSPFDYNILFIESLALYLHKIVIPQFIVECLLSPQEYLLSSETMLALMKMRGINMRYLGQIYRILNDLSFTIRTISRIRHNTNQDKDTLDTILSNPTILFCVEYQSIIDIIISIYNKRAATKVVNVPPQPHPQNPQQKYQPRAEDTYANTVVSSITDRHEIHTLIDLTIHSSFLPLLRREIIARCSKIAFKFLYTWYYHNKTLSSLICTTKYGNNQLIFIATFLNNFLNMYSYGQHSSNHAIAKNQLMYYLKFVQQQSCIDGLLTLENLMGSMGIDMDFDHDSDDEDNEKPTTIDHPLLIRHKNLSTFSDKLTKELEELEGTVAAQSLLIDPNGNLLSGVEKKDTVPVPDAPQITNPAINNKIAKKQKSTSVSQKTDTNTKDASNMNLLDLLHPQVFFALLSQICKDKFFHDLEYFVSGMSTLEYNVHIENNKKEAKITSTDSENTITTITPAANNIIKPILSDYDRYLLLRQICVYNGIQITLPNVTSLQQDGCADTSYHLFANINHTYEQRFFNKFLSLSTQQTPVQSDFIHNIIPRVKGMAFSNNDTNALYLLGKEQQLTAFEILDEINNDPTSTQSNYREELLDEINSHYNGCYVELLESLRGIVAPTCLPLLINSEPSVREYPTYSSAFEDITAADVEMNNIDTTTSSIAPSPQTENIDLLLCNQNIYTNQLSGVNFFNRVCLPTFFNTTALSLASNINAMYIFTALNTLSPFKNEYLIASKRLSEMENMIKGVKQEEMTKALEDLQFLRKEKTIVFERWTTFIIELYQNFELFLKKGNFNTSSANPLNNNLQCALTTFNTSNDSQRESPALIYFYMTFARAFIDVNLPNYAIKLLLQCTTLLKLQFTPSAYQYSFYYPFILYNLGLCFWDMKDYEKARELLALAASTVTKIVEYNEEFRQQYENYLETNSSFAEIPTSLFTTPTAPSTITITPSKYPVIDIITLSELRSLNASIYRLLSDLKFITGDLTGAVDIERTKLYPTAVALYKYNNPHLFSTPELDEYPPNYASMSEHAQKQIAAFLLHRKRQREQAERQLADQHLHYSAMAEKLQEFTHQKQSKTSLCQQLETKVKTALQTIQQLKGTVHKYESIQRQSGKLTPQQRQQFETASAELENLTTKCQDDAKLSQKLQAEITKNSQNYSKLENFIEHTREEQSNNRLLYLNGWYSPNHLKTHFSLDTSGASGITLMSTMGGGRNYTPYLIKYHRSLLHHQKNWLNDDDDDDDDKKELLQNPEYIRALDRATPHVGYFAKSTTIQFPLNDSTLQKAAMDSIVYAVTVGQLTTLTNNNVPQGVIIPPYNRSRSSAGKQHFAFKYNLLLHMQNIVPPCQMGSLYEHKLLSLDERVSEAQRKYQEFVAHQQQLEQIQQQRSTASKSQRKSDADDQALKQTFVNFLNAMKNTTGKKGSSKKTKKSDKTASGAATKRVVTNSTQAPSGDVTVAKEDTKPE